MLRIFLVENCSKILLKTNEKCFNDFNRFWKNLNAESLPQNCRNKQKNIKFNVSFSYTLQHTQGATFLWKAIIHTFLRQFVFGGVWKWERLKKKHRKLTKNKKSQVFVWGWIFYWCFIFRKQQHTHIFEVFIGLYLLKKSFKIKFYCLDVCNVKVLYSYVCYVFLSFIGNLA